MIRITLMLKVNVLIILFVSSFFDETWRPGIYNLEVRNDDSVLPFGELGKEIKFNKLVRNKCVIFFSDNDDTIPGSIHNQQQPDDFYIPQIFPNIFNSNPFFSTFGGFGFTNQRQPWWKG